MPRIVRGGVRDVAPRHKVQFAAKTVQSHTCMQWGVNTFDKVKADILALQMPTRTVIGQGPAVGELVEVQVGNGAGVVGHPQCQCTSSQEATQNTTQTLDV